MFLVSHHVYCIDGSYNTKGSELKYVSSLLLLIFLYVFMKGFSLRYYIILVLTLR